MEQTLPQLVKRAQDRDSEAFARLVELEERSMLALAYAILGDATSAGDVVQDACVKAWLRLAELRDPGRFSPWLAQIVRNVALDHRRRNPAGNCGIDEVDPPHLCDPGEALVQRERDNRVNSALARLDEMTRAVVILRYYENLASKQIGAMLNLSPAAVDMRLSRGREELRQLLASEMSEQETK